MTLRRRLSTLALASLILIAAGCGRCKPATKLSINFGGAVAFVLADVGDAEKGYSSHVTALAVRDNSIYHPHLGDHLKKDVGYFDKAVPVPAHYAFLRVKAKNLCVGLGGPCEASPQLGEAEVYYHLDGLNIKIDKVESDEGMVKLLYMAPVPRLAGIAPGTELLGQVCGECLNGDQDDLKRVAARFRFAQGVLHPEKVGHQSETLWYHEAGTGKEIKVDDVPPITLFERVTLDSEIHGDIVRVDLVPLRGGGGTEEHFRLRAAPGEKTIVIDLFDAPASDILCRDAHCEGVGYPYDNKTVSHFELFYALSKYRETPDVRFVFPKVRTGGGLLGNPYCSIVRMEQ